jgi:hypothetical protein
MCGHFMQDKAMAYTGSQRFHHHLIQILSEFMWGHAERKGMNNRGSLEKLQ